jgi:hypothetical protein
MQRLKRCINTCQRVIHHVPDLAQRVPSRDVIFKIT